MVLCCRTCNFAASNNSIKEKFILKNIAMKKFILFIMIAFTTSTYAINPTVSGTFSKLTNATTFQTIRQYLGVNSSQVEELETIFSTTSQKLTTASEENSDISAENAINYNLNSVKSILSQSQYRKYLLFISMSIKSESELAQN